MDDARNLEKLMLFGLTRQEALLYLCLYHNGELTGYEASKLTGISRSNVYMGLADLVDQGAAYVAGGSANKYTAVPIDEFCDNYVRKLTVAKDYLEKNIPAPAAVGEGYITIQGARHIEDKVLHMLRGAEKRIYLSAPLMTLDWLSGELLGLSDRRIKVVLIADRIPEALEENTDKGILFYKLNEDEMKSRCNQIRLIIDSAYVLTGDMKGESSDTCLYSDQVNFVTVFKEAMHNEMELIELRRSE
ncbi:MAG TPA: helix-turn-helix domain-containing protein [Lachnospiraceae bacterium]|nr:helix-turn-helix domain-containing protein [Lachnospiraceae bacterium]